MIIFTSICANYLHKARTLAKSVKENIEDSTFIVCLLESELKENYNYESFDEIILAKDAWEGNFERFIFKHTIVEASTSVKGQFFRFLYKKFPNENKFVYLDPDTYVYSEFYELKEILNKESIVLCPHLLQPGNIDMELSSAAHGVFNLGFLAVNNSDEAKSFIDWWSDRLYLYCYDEKEKGIFTDQKWINLAPCFFNVHIFKHRGYDFATWSLLDSGMEEISGEIFIKGDPLRFIHFSGYGRTIENCMRNWLPEGKHPFKSLYKDYSLIHDKNNSDEISKVSWTYGYYSNGEKISNDSRYKYRTDYELMFSVENPFELNERFFNNLRKNRKNYLKKCIKFLKKIKINLKK